MGSYDIGFKMELALKNLGFVSQFSKEFGVLLELANKVKQFLKKEKNLWRRSTIDSSSEIT